MSKIPNLNSKTIKSSNKITSEPKTNMPICPDEVAEISIEIGGKVFERFRVCQNCKRLCPGNALFCEYFCLWCGTISKVDIKKPKNTDLKNM